MAYYSDPTFLERMQAMRAPGQTFGGPFAATRNAVAQRLQGQSNRNVMNALAQQGADFRYNQAQFQNSQNWANWGNRLQRAAQDVSAREAINYQRNMAYAQQRQAEKNARRSVVGSAIGGLGAVAGTVFGGPVGGAIGGTIGNYVGGSL